MFAVGDSMRRKVTRLMQDAMAQNMEDGIRHLAPGVGSGTSGICHH